MLKTSQVNYIMDLSNSGYRVAEISKKLKLDRKTVWKYLGQEDFSPTPPVKPPVPSKLAPYKPKILEWLAEDQQDRRSRKKQLRTLAELTSRYGLETALEAMERSIHGGHLSSCDAAVLAATSSSRR